MMQDKCMGLGIWDLGPLFTKEMNALKPRDTGLHFSNRSEILQATRQQHCRDACQISER